jgi:hypothetical protein
MKDDTLNPNPLNPQQSTATTDTANVSIIDPQQPLNTTGTTTSTDTPAVSTDTTDQLSGNSLSTSAAVNTREPATDTSLQRPSFSVSEVQDTPSVETTPATNTLQTTYAQSVANAIDAKNTSSVNDVSATYGINQTNSSALDMLSGDSAAQTSDTPAVISGEDTQTQKPADTVFNHLQSENLITDKPEEVKTDSPIIQPTQPLADEPVAAPPTLEDTKPLTSPPPTIDPTNQMDIPPAFNDAPVQVAQQQQVEDKGPSVEEMTTETLITSDNNPKRSAFPIIMTILIIITLIILGGVGYLYFQRINNNTDEQPQATGNREAMLAFSPDQIQIINGDVVRVLPFGESRTLVFKSNFPKTGIAGFSRVVVSPNEDKICFESWAPAPEPELYIADVDGTNVKMVAASAGNCLFGPLGNRIFYNEIPTGNQQADIFSYNMNTEITTNLSEELKESENNLIYKLDSIDAATSTLRCFLQEADPATGSILGEPEPCEIGI